MNKPNSVSTILAKVATPITASGQSSATPAGGYQSAVLHVNATTAGGTTPSLTVTLQDSPDGTTWYDVASMTAITAAGQYRLNVSGFGPFLRVKYVVSGTTPSFACDIAISGIN